MHSVPFVYALKTIYTVPMGTRVVNGVAFAIVTNTARACLSKWARLISFHFAPLLPDSGASRASI